MLSGVKWMPPLVGFFKINIDGSFLQDANSGSSGFVIRDSVGAFLAGGGEAYWFSQQSM